MADRRVLFCSLLICAFFFSAVFSSVKAAFFIFDPNSLDVKKDEDFQIKINIDTEGEQPKTAEAIVLFDETQLQVVSLSEAAEGEKFYPVFLKKITSNKINVGGAIRPSEEPKSGKGTIAVVTFKAKTSSKNILSFLCQPGKTTDSNINVRKGGKPTDVIDCAKLNEATITIGGADAPTSTPGPSSAPSSSPAPSLTSGALSPTPSSTPTLTPTLTLTPTIVATASPTLILSPTPASLPDTGSADLIIKSVGIGLLLVIASVVVKFIFL